MQGMCEVAGIIIFEWNPIEPTKLQGLKRNKGQGWIPVTPKMLSPELTGDAEGQHKATSLKRHRSDVACVHLKAEY